MPSGGPATRSGPCSPMPTGRWRRPAASRPTCTSWTCSPGASTRSPRGHRPSRPTATPRPRAARRSPSGGAARSGSRPNARKHAAPRWRRRRTLMPVADWFVEFCVSVTEAIPRSDWPEIGNLYWQVMERALVRDGVRHGAANRALYTLSEAPPKYLEEIRTGLINLARTYQTQEANAQATDGAEMDRDAAAECSRDCEECGGTGLTTRAIHSRKWDRRMRVGCICHLCPMGRWVARQHAEGSQRE